MDRLQKKCFIGSAAGHVLLLTVLLTGSAFVTAPRKNPEQELTVINFVAFKTVDELVAPGGGNPNAAPPPEVLAAPPVVTPAPAAPEPEPPAPAPAAREPEPEPQPEVPAPKPAVREPAPKPAPKPLDNSSLVPGAEKKKRVIDLKPVVRNLNAKSDSKKRAEARAREAAQQEKAALDARKRLARGFAAAASAIGKNVSGGISIEAFGPGGGGVPYANFDQAVLSAYDRAWQLPAGVTDTGATAVATITIARDGTVISARISDPSGNATVDASVRRTLDRVKWVAPLPERAREDQRTLKINFNVGAKQGLG